MTTNDQIILNGILTSRQNEIEPEADPSSFFVFFTAEQILKDFDFSYAEIETGLVDNPGDGGIDAAYFVSERRFDSRGLQL